VRRFCVLFLRSQAKKRHHQNRLLQTTIGTAILFQTKSCIFSSPLTKKLSAVSVATLVTHHPTLFKAPNAFQLLWFRSPSPLIVATVQQRGRCKRKPCLLLLLAALLLLVACRCCLPLLLLAAAACCLRLALPTLPHRSVYACSSLAQALPLPLQHPNRLPQLSGHLKGRQRRRAAARDKLLANLEARAAANTFQTKWPKHPST